MKGLAVFTLGAIVGAVATALLTPVSGDELRERVRYNLRRLGFTAKDNIDELVDVIAAEIATTEAIRDERNENKNKKK